MLARPQSVTAHRAVPRGPYPSGHTKRAYQAGVTGGVYREPQWAEPRASGRAPVRRTRLAAADRLPPSGDREIPGSEEEVALVRLAAGLAVVAKADLLGVVGAELIAEELAV